MRICVIHLNQIGDMVFSLPLLKTLRDNYPQAIIHSVIRPYLEGLVKGSPYIDRLILRPEGVINDVMVLHKIRRSSYDLLICLPRSEAAMFIATMSRSRKKAGFCRVGFDYFLDVKVPVKGHNSWYNNARLLEALDIDTKKNDYVGLLRAEGEAVSIDLPERFAVISPGASKRRQAKAWRVDGFSDVISRLWSDGLASVIVGAPNEWALNEEIRQGALSIERHALVLNLSGKFRLDRLLNVLKRSELFVGIDSGVMHLASALDIPTVAIFGPTDPLYVGPQNKKSMVVRRDDLECIPCYLKPCEHRQCLEGLEADAVYRACKTLIG